MSKKRRARTRRQSQIRRQEQIRRETAGRRDDVRPSTVRADERRAQREAELAPLAARYRFLKWLMRLAAVCLAYGIGLWFVQLLERDTLTKHYPGVWTGLLIGLGVAVAVCWIPGLFLTVRDRAWFWVVVIAVPVTTMPALFYYCYTRRQMLRRAMGDAGPGAGGGRSRTARRPSVRKPPRRPPDRRPPAGGRPGVGGGQQTATDSIKLLGDR